MKTMKFIAIILLTFFGASNSYASSKSVLTNKIDVPGIGAIAYRPPLVENKGEVVVLFQGIFGGTTHRHFNELRDLLDSSGARVFTMDLPGTGESASPKIVYTMDAVIGFVNFFLKEVVKEPSIVVAEQSLGLAALESSKLNSEMYKKLIVIAPTGVRYLSVEPNDKQKSFFDKFWNSETDSMNFYLDLVSEKSARYYMNRAYYNPAEVTDERVSDITMTSQFTEQRWASICFVAGKIFLSYAQASKDVTVPVTVIFGDNPSSPVTGGLAETVDLFEPIQPIFKYEVIKDSGNLPHKEKTVEVAKIILN